RCNNNKLEQCCSCHNRKVTTTITTTTTTTTIRTTDDGDAEQQRYRCCATAQDELIDPHLTNIDHAILIPLSTLPEGVNDCPSATAVLPSPFPSPSTEPSVTVSPSERPDDLVILLTPPVTPQLVAQEEEDTAYSTATDSAKQINANSTVVETEHETNGPVSLILGNQAELQPTAQDEPTQILAYPTPKIEPDTVSTVDGDTIIVVSTTVMETTRAPIAPCEEPARPNGVIPSRSRSLSSLHDSSSASRSSSCSSPAVDANAPPELSKSATVAMFTFQRNRRKGSGRKRKKRRDRHRK
uniref:Uncharacterized protein n=1 Tax=Anopheles culicifacies TaxID=139723 RepID=A0A182ML58_9DIPT